MAQVVDYYRGEAQGGATMYVYAQPDNTSTAVRIYSGSPIALPADYQQHETNGMYPTINPGGWIYYYNIGPMEAVYKTVTDPCTPPQSVALEGETLVITGGSGGDLNDFTGWGVSSRERGINDTVWGEWSPDTVAQASPVSVTSISGKVVQFRVRTLGSAGEAYFSNYVECETLLNGNSAAGVPIVELPVAGASARCHTPSIRINCPPDPDGDAIRLMRSIDGGEWTLAASLPGTGGVVIDHLPALSEGEHAVEYKSVDANGLSSGVDRAGFTVLPYGWRREIHAGDVISNLQISHAADLREMLSAVNGMRAFYGLGPVAFSGTVGRFADWQAQLQLLISAVDEVYSLMERTRPDWPEVPAWPAAAPINAVREACEA